MFNEIDDKGKIFTNVITKKATPVIIQTLTHKITGEIHVRPNHRLVDEVNFPETFIVVTDAMVVNLKGEPLYRAKFLSLNKAQIVWVIPADEMTEGS